MKNRLHLDLHPNESLEVEVERLVVLGANAVRVVHENADDLFTVMQDIEGNEFCVESVHGPVG